MRAINRTLASWPVRESRGSTRVASQFSAPTPRTAPAAPRSGGASPAHACRARAFPRLGEWLILHSFTHQPTTFIYSLCSADSSRKPERQGTGSETGFFRVSLFLSRGKSSHVGLVALTLHGCSRRRSAVRSIGRHCCLCPQTSRSQRRHRLSRPPRCWFL